MLAIWRPGKTEVAEPLMEIARAIDAEKLLLLMRRLLAEAPAPTPVDTEVIATGGNVAFVLDAPGPAKKPNVVFSEPFALVAVLMFLPGELPMIFRFAIVSLFAVAVTVVARAIRTTEVNVVVLVAVF